MTKEFRVPLWDYVGRTPKVFDCPAERVEVYAYGLSASAVACGNLTLDASADWPNRYGVLHPYERWNARGLGIAAVHWIRSSDSNWAARPKAMAFGRPRESGYHDGLARHSEISKPAKLIWFGDGDNGTAALWKDDNWWIKSATAAGYAQGAPGLNRLLQNDYGCRRRWRRPVRTCRRGQGCLPKAGGIMNPNGWAPPRFWRGWTCTTGG